ncbi:prepilin-type N-terminal cleavage/methylation domain-containing protein [Undibacterium sp.]|uniref:prepilin-type N-terminal cleavage/methylation domain-containing protein n=1 Tax=Undibacterium sp. TaxID=1914977 RepID=UPI00374FFFC6
MRKAGLTKQAGFTLAELIIVIVLIAILGGIGVSRSLDRQSFDARTFVDRTQLMLRYGQKLAIAQNRPVYVRLDGASIAMCFNYPSDGSFPNCTVDNQVATPALKNSETSNTLAACNNVSTWNCEGLPTGISYTLSPSISYFYFDALGKPFAAADVSPTPVSSFALLRIRITGDGNNHDIYVEPETGYVHF